MALNHFLQWQQGTTTAMGSTLVIALLFAFTAICSSCFSIRRKASIDPNEMGIFDRNDTRYKPSYRCARDSEFRFPLKDFC